jgi:hypothetical protein
MEGGTFTTEGHTVTMTGTDGGDPLECTLDAATITCIQGSATLVFTRGE